MARGKRCGNPYKHSLTPVLPKPTRYATRDILKPTRAGGAGVDVVPLKVVVHGEYQIVVCRPAGVLDLGQLGGALGHPAAGVGPVGTGQEDDIIVVAHDAADLVDGLLLDLDPVVHVHCDCGEGRCSGQFDRSST